jgi:predicted phosphoadenosine phosphosulfate sulfurtransferase
MEKKYLGLSVLDEAKNRIVWTFDTCEKIYISFSGGKDSSVMLHLVMEEAIKRKRKVGLFILDWECQYELTIDHIEKIIDLYKDHIELFWVQLEITTNNASSALEPLWKSWDESKKVLWTRDKSPLAIKDAKYFPFYYSDITFEEFVPLFGKWYSENKTCGCFVGIRTYESLNRFRAIAREKPTLEGKKYTTNVVDSVWNVYPIYDWQTKDIWIYNAKHDKPYNKLYDRFYQAGLSIHQMRIDEPFGEEARRSLWLYQIIEPKTWSKFIARMSGVNSGALYCKDRGNILGNAKVSLPEGHTWESFSRFILGSMPPNTAEHYKNKIAVYIQWYKKRGYPEGIPDEADYRMEQLGKVPAWRQICKTLLRNDWYCRGIGFSVTKSSAYSKYMDLMRKRRKNWGIFNEELN